MRHTPPRRRGGQPFTRLPTALSVAVKVSLLSACAASTPPPLTSVSEGWSEEGRASWYGPGFHGKRTASGEVYDMEDMTAAHKRLPFGTRVRVHNLDNGRRTVVRINDRGPFVNDRVIDLSRAAAREIKMLGPGTARVRIVVVEVSGLVACSMVQIGAFAERRNAEDAARRMRAAGESATLEEGSDGLTRVVIGPYSDLVVAERARARYEGLLRECGET